MKKWCVRLSRLQGGCKIPYCVHNICSKRFEICLKNSQSIVGQLFTHIPQEYPQFTQCPLLLLIQFSGLFFCQWSGRWCRSPGQRRRSLLSFTWWLWRLQAVVYYKWFEKFLSRVSIWRDNLQHLLTITREYCFYLIKF